MRHQRSIKPYAKPIAPVAGTVPITGVEPSVSLQMADRLANQRTRTSESINRGRFLYETYCLVCHGVAGQGDGPSPGPTGPTTPACRFRVVPPLRGSTYLIYAADDLYLSVVWAVYM